MAIIKNIVNPENRQVMWFHKLTGLQFDRLSWKTTVILDSWLDENDYKENISMPIKSVPIVFGKDLVDTTQKEVENNDKEIKIQYKKSKTDWVIPEDMTLEQFKYHAQFPDTVMETEIYRSREYEFDMNKTIDETYADIYTKIEQFPDFRK